MVPSFFLMQKYLTFSATLNSKKSNNEGQKPSIVIQQLQICEKDKQQQYNVTVNAHEGRFFYPSSLIEATDVTCNIKQNGQDIGSLHAQKSSIDQNKKNAFLPGPVHGHLKNISLKCSDIFYDINQNKAFTNHPTSCTHPLFTIIANQATIDFSQDTLSLQEGVYSEFSCGSTTNKRSN